MKKPVIYNHGKDSVPWGEKTIGFAEVAKRYGYTFESPDYTKQMNPDKRVGQLLAMDLSGYDESVLIGSSMGAYVATVASESIKPKGFFLLAPAFYLPDYRQTEFKPTAAAIRVFHGWQDDIVPSENTWRFCQKYRLFESIRYQSSDVKRDASVSGGEFSRFLAGLSRHAI